MVRLQLRFSGALWAVWVGSSWEGSPVFDYPWLPRCRCGGRAVQQLPPERLVDLHAAMWTPPLPLGIPSGSDPPEGLDARPTGASAMELRPQAQSAGTRGPATRLQLRQVPLPRGTPGANGSDARRIAQR